MTSKQHIVYIPGLGDGYDMFRKAGLLLWRKPGTKTTLVSMHWMDTHESYEDKLGRIKKAIDKYPSHKVVLVGESAGGAMSIVAMRRFRSKIHRLVTVCGMNQGAGNVSGYVYYQNKAFKYTMEEADTITPTLSAEDRRSMLTIYSPLDATVTPKATLLDGVKAHKLFIPGHLPTIFVVLFFKFRKITISSKPKP